MVRPAQAYEFRLKKEASIMADQSIPAVLPTVQYQRILHATDFSPLSAHAMAHALKLAQTFGAQLHLLHVVDEAAYYWVAAGPDALPLGPLPVDLAKTAENLMQRLVQTHVPAGMVCVHKVIVGRPFVEIIRYAEEEKCSLIVVGTHGRGAIVHALMGSTAERVVRKAPCPVLTVRDPMHSFSMP